ncbi:MAG: hypothetical protein SVE93_05445 [Candidatus Thermoplasmatota archaeon]|nr:hypothetical protein [Candidatus Thermoplasmatota archaeon]
MPLVKCPACGFTFDKSYARAFACKGCSYMSCNMTICPKCKREFEL